LEGVSGLAWVRASLGALATSQPFREIMQGVNHQSVLTLRVVLPLAASLPLPRTLWEHFLDGVPLFLKELLPDLRFGGFAQVGVI
jgi:hypothetical protein